MTRVRLARLSIGDGVIISATGARGYLIGRAETPTGDPLAIVRVLARETAPTDVPAPPQGPPPAAIVAAPGMLQRWRTAEYDIQGRYGPPCVWETVTTEETRKGAIAMLRDYRENEPGIPFRVRRRMVPVFARTAEGHR